MPLQARYSEGEPIPGPGTWRDLVRLVRSRTIKAVAPLYVTVRRWGTDLVYGPPARFSGIITAAGGAYTVAEARFTPSTGAWSAIAGGRVVTNAYEYNGLTTVPVGTAVEVRLSIAGDWRFYRPSMGASNPGDACATPPALTFSISISCCCPMSDPVAVTWTYGGSSIGSCTATPAVVETGNATTCYTRTQVTGQCTITNTTLSLGTVVNWTATGAIVGSYSGTMTIQCDGDARAVAWDWVDHLPSTIHVTDPDGFSVPLTLTFPGSRTWTGSHSTSRLDSVGAAQVFTTSYTWRGCLLAIDTYTADPCPNLNHVSTDAAALGLSDPAFLALPAWPVPADQSKNCFPLLIVYTPWFGVVTSTFHPGVLKKGGCSDANLFGTRFSIGGQWRKWTCGDAWTVTL